MTSISTILKKKYKKLEIYGLFKPKSMIFWEIFSIKNGTLRGVFCKNGTLNCGGYRALRVLFALKSSKMIF